MKYCRILAEWNRILFEVFIPFAWAHLLPVLVEDDFDNIFQAWPRQQPHVSAGDDPVGLQSIGALYLSVPGETYQDGAKYTSQRGTFVKHVAITPFGRTNYWEKVA